MSEKLLILLFLTGLVLRCDLVFQLWPGMSQTEVDQLDYFQTMDLWHFVSRTQPAWETLSTWPYALMEQLNLPPRLTGLVFF